MYNLFKRDVEVYVVRYKLSPSVTCSRGLSVRHQNWLVRIPVHRGKRCSPAVNAPRRRSSELAHHTSAHHLPIISGHHRGIILTTRAAAATRIALRHLSLRDCNYNLSYTSIIYFIFCEVGSILLRWDRYPPSGGRASQYHGAWPIENEYSSFFKEKKKKIMGSYNKCIYNPLCS